MTCIRTIMFSASLVLLTAASTPALADSTATQGIVTGKVQMVGFRAMILKNAIAQNLSGMAVNLPDGRVQFVLQGDSKRIKEALDAIGMGTDKSADVKVATKSVDVDPKLKTFTVKDWTSTSRMISNKYDLVFKLRGDDSTISAKKASKEYHQILLDTLDDDDREKLADSGD